MYNRYMPTGNGQFQRQTVPGSPQPGKTESKNKPKPEEPPKRQQAAEKSCTPSTPEASRRDSTPRPAIPFLNRLLPGMDSGDMLVVLILLLLLMEGNEDSTSVIMTLAIFLFLQ